VIEKTRGKRETLKVLKAFLMTLFYTTIKRSNKKRVLVFRVCFFFNKAKVVGYSLLKLKVLVIAVVLLSNLSSSSAVNVVIPMAGNGSRFAQVGYKNPKPFIDVLGKPMIAHVLDNLALPNATYTLIARSEHLAACPEVVEQLKQQYAIQFITVDQLTEGAACTILHAHRIINNETPLLLANSDQLIDFSVAEFINQAQAQQADGSILTFEANHPKWSYAKLGADGWVDQVAEKVVISNHATVGVYYFRTGKLFVEAALDMIIANDRFNNEFYACPSYNYLLKQQGKVSIFEIMPEQMHGLGTPEDLAVFLSHHAENARHPVGAV
jgi:UDP-N-acetylglucosamine diphosphorylase / glucose-1-phosphate thymidylyltransferase / UDP-N-acetylgalactosamine diphosphorylase / glucosamine-1-phosphate N-acetyltransferase / galactosamine-1-phosphate N-acetyltransferase